MTATLTAQLSADIRKKREHTMVDFECLNYVLNLLTCSTHGIWLGHTQNQGIVAIVAYSWILRLHWQRVDIMVALLDVDGTLDSRLAAILQRNGEGYGDSSYDTMNHCLTLLALHSYKKDQLLTQCTFKLGQGCDFPKMLHLLLLKVTLTL